MLKVLLTYDFTSAFSRLLMEGFLQYSTEVGGWRFYRIPVNRVNGNENLSSIIEDIVHHWKADAIVGQLPESETNRLNCLGIPVILQNYTQRITGFSNITGDYYATGELAANYFIHKGYTHFAYYGTDRTIWSREREKGFCDSLRCAGLDVQVYNEKNDIQYGSTSEQQVLQSWLSHLPKPVALFACNDMFALRVTETCNICDIHIPQDLAVLGVDNDEILCHMSDPPISSIALDVKNGGYQAARLLHDMIKDKQQSNRDIVIKPIRIVRRKSTEGYSIYDPLVIKALKFIETRYNKNICISEILEQVCVSRRVLEKHFKKEMGISVYQYILDYRAFCLAEQLLASDKSILEISIELGYDNYTNLSKSFKRIYQMTPTQYRNFYKKYPSHRG